MYLLDMKRYVSEIRFVLIKKEQKKKGKKKRKEEEILW